MSAETTGSAAAEADAAPLDLLLTDAALGVLNRWPDHAAWLAERCGEEEAAPAELGGGGLAPICDAPGTYVYDR